MKRIFTAIALAAPFSLAAQGPSYTHLEGGLNWVDPPGRFGSSDLGILVRGSYALDDTVFLRGGLSSHRFDYRVGPPGDRRTRTWDRDILSAGAGFRVPMENNIDAYGAVDLLHDFGDADDTGFRLEGGVRTVFVPSWDSTAGLRYARLDSHDNIQLFANTFYEVAPQFSVGGEVAVGDYDELTLGARYRF